MSCNYDFNNYVDMFCYPGGDTSTINEGTTDKISNIYMGLSIVALLVCAFLLWKSYKV